MAHYMRYYNVTINKLPMQKIYSAKTQPKSETSINSKPKASTIEFLKQFARAYTFEPALKGNLCNFIAN